MWQIKKILVSFLYKETLVWLFSERYFQAQDMIDA